MIHSIQKYKKRRRQILISTHSETLLSDKSIDGHEVLRLSPSPEGTTINWPTIEEVIMLKSGLSPAEVLMPETKPPGLTQLELFYGRGMQPHRNFMFRVAVREIEAWLLADRKGTSVFTEPVSNH